MVLNISSSLALSLTLCLGKSFIQCVTASSIYCYIQCLCLEARDQSNLKNQLFFAHKFTFVQVINSPPHFFFNILKDKRAQKLKERKANFHKHHWTLCFPSQPGRFFAGGFQHCKCPCESLCIPENTSQNKSAGRLNINSQSAVAHSPPSTIPPDRARYEF